MAVYKATYCYPFLGSCDLRVAPGETQWITCKVDSSNKRITGYRIKIYNKDGKCVFPLEQSKVSVGGGRDWNVSPVSELSSGEGLLRRGGKLVMKKQSGGEIELPSQEYMANSGENGTYLNVPFFQNAHGKITQSANAVYFIAENRADYVIRPLGDFAKTPENSYFWKETATAGVYEYVESDENGHFKGDLNGDSGVSPQNTVLFGKKDGERFIGVLEYDGNVWSIKKSKELKSGDLCVIMKGAYHGVCYSMGSEARSAFYKYSGDLWTDAEGNGLSFTPGDMYKWEITLYQGDGDVRNKFIDGEFAYSLIDYSSLNVDFWYDMMLQRAKVLGTAPNRIQIAKKGKDGSYSLPTNKDGSGVLLYGTYAQLLSGGSELGYRFYVNSYSSSLGHVYPTDTDANSITVSGATGIKFYEHSNNPDAVLSGDAVQVASVATAQYEYRSKTGDVELCGLHNIDGVVGESGMYVLLMYQKDPAENGVYKMASDAGAWIKIGGKNYVRNPNIDAFDEATGLEKMFGWTYTPSEEAAKAGETSKNAYTTRRYCVGGSLYWLKVSDTRNTKADGTIESSQIPTWSRAAGYTSWGNFLGKVVYVRSGEKNGGRNFSSTAQSGGKLLEKPYSASYVDSSSFSGGSTPLYFVGERPVVLFPQFLYDKHPIKALGAFVKSSGTESDSVDGVFLSPGDYYVDEATGDVMRYSSKGSAGSIEENHESIPAGESVYYRILQGQKNGLTVCKVDRFGIREKSTEDLSVADVLFNTKTVTFVSPSTSLAPGMVLSFGGEKVLPAGGGARGWLRVDSVDSTVWSVSHEELEKPFESYSNDPAIPYYYELLSFFKKSDENPFYYRESPYLRITNGLGDGYSSVGVDTLFDVSSGGSTKPLSASLQSFGLSTKSDEAKWDAMSYGDSAFGDWTFSVPTLKSDAPAAGDAIGKFSTVAGTATVKGKGVDDASKTAFMNEASAVYSGGAEDIGVGTDALSRLKMPGALAALSTQKYADGSGNWAPVGVVAFSPELVSGYRAELSGLYFQGNGGSWEYYRWKLSKVKFSDSFYEANKENLAKMAKNNEPEVYAGIEKTLLVKDTGNKYDKKISATFNGLVGSTLEEGWESLGGEDYSDYYLVELTVTDDKGNEAYLRRILRYEEPKTNFDYRVSKFSAKMDCRNACVSIEVNPSLVDASGASPADEDLKKVNEFSIFRREFETAGGKTVVGVKWDPVAVGVTSPESGSVGIRDFNVLAGHSYQYALFPGDYSEKSTKIPYAYANSGDGGSAGAWDCYDQSKSAPVKASLQYWSIVGLVDATDSSAAPSGEEAYAVDPDNVWLFKFQMEAGSLTQNVSKSEISTLGRYARVGVGKKDYLSGSVSCYLGSEIAPLSRSSYLERMPRARISPLSTNERAYMVGKWREFVRSANPKLLRDTKGQGWIVQIMDGSTTTSEAISSKPDVISFSWRQIGDAAGATICARDSELLDQVESAPVCADRWGE